MGMELGNRGPPGLTEDLRGRSLHSEPFPPAKYTVGFLHLPLKTQGELQVLK